jgi:predicted nucleic acid-binding protein
VIVVDTNVIAYCWLRGARTAAAQRVRLRDPDWHVPVLWRSEMCSVLAGYLRKGALALDEAWATLAQAEAALAGREHLPSSVLVLELAAKTRLSAYDCELVALSQALGVPLVTEDQAILEAFPDRAITPESFLRSPEGPPPGAHSGRAAYRVRAHHAAGSTR